jgi:hypothetical protein
MSFMVISFSAKLTQDCRPSSLRESGLKARPTNLPLRPYGADPRCTGIRAKQQASRMLGNEAGLASEPA